MSVTADSRVADDHSVTHKGSDKSTGTSHTVDTGLFAVVSEHICRSPLIISQLAVNLRHPQ